VLFLFCAPVLRPRAEVGEPQVRATAAAAAAAAPVGSCPSDER